MKHFSKENNMGLFQEVHMAMCSIGVGFNLEGNSGRL